MSADFVKIPSYSLSPDKLTLYERIEWKTFSERQVEAFKNLEIRKSKYNEISENGRKRLLNAVSYMLYISKNKNITGKQKMKKNIGNNEIEIEKGKKYKKSVKYKLTFITLTLSAKQMQDDKEITKHLLKRFLDELRRKWNVKHYVWKAEKQENGNIHYHILCDQFIKWQEIREKWNHIQNKEGFNYVDRYSAKMQEFFKDGFQMLPGDKRSFQKQLEAYYRNKENNWTNPNSTDIHALYKVKNIAGYITKYVAKSVTKTSRIQAMDELFEKIENIKRNIASLKYKNEFMTLADPGYIDNLDIIFKLEKEIREHEKELHKLREKGVTGRIWGQSQTLSKIKNFSVQGENFRDVPDIEIVDKIKRHESRVEISPDNYITTFFFDINKTPNLKRILNEHISKSLQRNIIDKLTFQNAQSEFEKGPPERGSVPDSEQMIALSIPKQSNQQTLML